MTTPILFSPLRIRGLELRNRVVVAPMHQYAAVDGFANDWHLMNAGRYAAGGAGLVIMESTKVERRGCGTVGDLGLWDDNFVPELARVAGFIRSCGAAAGIQLGDVDFLRKSRKASRQVQRVNGGAIDVPAPKYGSERVVYLTDSLVNVPGEHLTAHGTTGRWLFAGEGDDPPHQSTVGYWWRKTLRDAGLPASDSTTCCTSTPPASSRPGATS